MVAMTSTSHIDVDFFLIYSLNLLKYFRLNAVIFVWIGLRLGQLEFVCSKSLKFHMYIQCKDHSLEQIAFIITMLSLLK